MVTYNNIENTIEINNENVTLLDIYNTIQNSSIINMIGNNFEIYSSLHLVNNGSIEDKDVSCTIYGKYFTIDEGCHVKFGIKNADGTTSNGCNICMTAPELAYGFGSHYKSGDRTLSGNLYLYNSLIDIWCFWGFFAGVNQIVEIEDCLINGFGRIEGTNSILKNITFTQSDGRFGILSPKGDIRIMENLSSQKSIDCSVYFNPLYTASMKIVGGSYDNYSRLVYMEDNANSVISTIRFVDSNINGSFDCKWGLNTQLEIAYTFNPIFVDKDGNLIDVSVKIYDNINNLVFDGSSINGEINTELVYFSANNTNTVGKTFSPYKFDFTLNDGTVITRTLDIKVPIKKVPLIVSIDGTTNSTTSTTVDFTALETLIKQENQTTRDYILSMNDITYQGTRVLVKYGYRVRTIVGDPSNVILAKDYNIILSENDSKLLYEQLSFDSINKIVDCNGLDLNSVFHACHYKNYIEKSDEVILVIQNEKYGALNNWKLTNYTGLLDYYYQNDVKIYNERDVNCKIFVGVDAINGTCTLMIKNETGNIVQNISLSFLQASADVVCKTNGKYTYDVVITNSNGNAIFTDSGIIPREGFLITQRINVLDPSLQDEVGYFNASNYTLNQEHKTKLSTILGSTKYNNMAIYTDVSNDAYDSRGSYNLLMQRCARGEIRRIYMWDKAEFGVVRKLLSLDLLNIFNVEIVEIKGL